MSKMTVLFARANSSRSRTQTGILDIFFICILLFIFSKRSLFCVPIKPPHVPAYCAFRSEMSTIRTAGRDSLTLRLNRRSETIPLRPTYTPVWILVAASKRWSSSQFLVQLPRKKWCPGVFPTSFPSYASAGEQTSGGEDPKMKRHATFFLGDGNHRRFLGSSLWFFFCCPRVAHDHRERQTGNGSAIDILRKCDRKWLWGLSEDRCEEH